jgi:hypothetical protein
MEVKQKYIVSDNHSVEWGGATWDSEDFSIRNRYDTDEGKFNYAGSSELPWNDFNTMINESIKRRFFSKKEISEMLKSIAESLTD